MSQYDFGTLGTATTGIQLANALNAWRNAIHTSHSGTTAPTYKQIGMHWLDTTTATAWALKVWDGTSWLTILKINPSTNVVTFDSQRYLPPGSTAPAPSVAGDLWYDTNDQYLAVGTGGTPVTKWGGSSRWVRIGNSSTAGAASLNFANVGGYNKFRLHLSLWPATDAQQPIIRVSSNNGASYDAGATDYTLVYKYQTGSATYVGGTMNSTGINLVGGATGIGNLANEYMSSVVEIYNFNSATMFTTVMCRSTFISQTPAVYRWIARGHRLVAAAHDAFQIIMGSGNIIGWWYLEGAVV
jgi:hypothetical protein